MEIKLSGSVGAGGVNKGTEVRAIQVALNRWRATQTMPAIGVDGSIGGESIGAIKHFQKTQFGWTDPDGRIDPQGNSLKNLNAFLTGPTRRLLEPVRKFRRGVLTIEMGDDGEIVVRPGDWPSRYAIAIYGNPFKFDTFVRIDGEVLTPVVRPHAGPLRIGESIYDYEQYLRFMEKTNQPVPKKPTPAPPLPKTQQEKIIERVLQEDYNIKGEEAKFIGNVVTYLGYLGNAIDIVDATVAIFVESALLETIATVAAPIGIFVGIADACITFVNVSNTHARFAAYRGLVYAEVSWALGHLSPPSMSPLLRSNMSGLSDYDRNMANAEWSRVTAAVYARLNTEFNTDQKRKVARLALMQRFDNSPQKMCRAGLEAFENKFDFGAQRDTWKLGYRDLYPN